MLAIKDAFFNTNKKEQTHFFSDDFCKNSEIFKINY